MNRTQIYLDPEQRKVIKHIAVDKDTTMSDLIRKAIDNYILDQLVIGNNYLTKEYDQYLIDKINRRLKNDGR